MNGTGYIVFAHGSSVASANEAVVAVTERMAAEGFEMVEAAFLEGGRPDLKTAAARLAAQGVRRIVVIPYFLTLGLHLQRDLPRLIEDLQRSNAGIEIEVTPPLDGHPALLEALVDRAKGAVCKQD